MENITFDLGEMGEYLHFEKSLTVMKSLLLQITSKSLGSD